MAYAVVDFETTGILPSHHHRVVEIGITHVENDGSISGRWETLINPQRDLGPQSIHGIRGADLIDAPTFEDVAADVLQLLRDRTFVAHNASFDLRFLVSEFSRSGLYFGDSVPHICTLTLARSLGVPGRGALDTCCAHYGIPLVDAHTAGADSLATAHLLGAYLTSSQHDPSWGAYWNQVAALGQGFPYPLAPSNGVAWKPRGVSLTEPQHFLELIADPPLELRTEGAESAYLEALDKCLLDGVISAAESAELSSLATELGIDRADAAALHRRYFDELLRRAWADGVLTQSELEDLTSVAALLAIDSSSWNSDRPDAGFLAHSDAAAPTVFSLESGDHVVLTGEMRRPRSDWEESLRARSFVPHPRVTKQTKLLVAADPDSLSGKAQQARKYGIPVVGESWLEAHLPA